MLCLHSSGDLHWGQAHEQVEGETVCGAKENRGAVQVIDWGSSDCTDFFFESVDVSNTLTEEVSILPPGEYWLSKHILEQLMYGHRPFLTDAPATWLAQDDALPAISIRVAEIIELRI